jgi:hypothetical protein
MKRLTRRRLAEHYSGARSVFVEHDGDVAAAENAVRANPHAYGVAVEDIMLALQIMALLWQLWNRFGVSDPPGSFALMERDRRLMEGVQFEDE